MGIGTSSAELRAEDDRVCRLASDESPRQQRRGYGVAAAEEPLDSKEREGDDIYVNVMTQGTQPVEVAVRRGERVVRLKAKLFDMDGLDVPPPSATTLTLGGIELEDSDRFEDYDVEADATFVLSQKQVVTVTLPSPSSNPNLPNQGAHQDSVSWPELEAR